MSQLDVEWAIADFLGAFSIIVPSFGERGLSGWRGVAAYVREERAWRRFTRRELLASLEVRP